MHTHEQKNKKAEVKEVTQKKTKGAVFQFEDNRPETLQRRQMQQRMNNSSKSGSVVQQKANNTGLPDHLKAGIENLSGHAMDDVKVHYNSPKPAQLQAHAYAQGSQIHLGPGQEKHLPHEAWHVVQQKQGRVKPTAQLKENIAINDDHHLEREADVMGNILQRKTKSITPASNLVRYKPNANYTQLVKNGNFRKITGNSGYITLATDRRNMGHTYIILETKQGAWMYHFRADARNAFASLAKTITWSGTFEQIRRNSATNTGKSPQKFVAGRAMNFQELKVAKGKVEQVKKACQRAVGGGKFSLILSNFGYGNNCFSMVYNILKEAGFAFTWSSYLYSFISPRLALWKGAGFYEDKPSKSHKMSTYSHR